MKGIFFIIIVERKHFINCRISHLSFLFYSSQPPPISDLIHTTTIIIHITFFPHLKPYKVENKEWMIIIRALSTYSQPQLTKSRIVFFISLFFFDLWVMCVIMAVVFIVTFHAYIWLDWYVSNGEWVEVTTKMLYQILRFLWNFAGF